MSTILECKNLSKKYGRKQALDNITLSLENFLSMEIPLESNRKKSSPISQSVPT